jgi:hypothetical protein
MIIFEGKKREKYFSLKFLPSFYPKTIKSNKVLKFNAVKTLTTNARKRLLPL